jgi:HEAT repeat protein
MKALRKLIPLVIVSLCCCNKGAPEGARPAQPAKVEQPPKAEQPPKVEAPKVEVAKTVPELARAVDDPASPPALVRASVVALGRSGDPAAIQPLLHALFADRRSESFLPEASLALFLVGQPVVEPLLRIARDQDRAFLDWAAQHGVGRPAIYSRSALVLGDLEDPRAIPVLIGYLRYSADVSDPSVSRPLTSVVRRFAATALGRMRAKEAAAPLQALVTTNEQADKDVVAAAAEALVWIGDRPQARELSKKAEGGALDLRLLLTQAAALFGEPALGKDVLNAALRESKRAPADCARQLGALGLNGFDPRTACDLLATQFGELANPLEAARVCSQDVPCWLPKLKDGDPVVRARAAYELGRAGAPEAVSPLVDAARDDQPLVREAAARALDWLCAVPAAKPGLRDAAPRIEAQLAGQSRSELVKVDEDLRRVQVKMSRL